MQQRTYGSAMSALETTYINLCVEHKSYGYIDEMIDNACTDGETFVLININNIPAESEQFSIKNKEFLTKMINIFYNLGYQIEMKDNNYLFISWLNPYHNIQEYFKEDI